MNGCVLPGTSIAVDFWNTGKHPGIKLFFLTHLHGDHVVGLTSSWRQPLYCSPLTGQLLVQRYGVARSLVHSLEVNQSHVIDYCQGSCKLLKNHGNSVKVNRSSNTSSTVTDQRGSCDSVCVTVIDANHCPGAVMFLFEGTFGKILYTGDFRFHPDMFKYGSLLSKHVGTIDKVYLDNTYCSPACTFPPRLEALEEIVQIVNDHRDHDVVFGIRGLGKEELLAAVALAVDEWINVPPHVMSVVAHLDLPNVFKTCQPDSRLRVVRYQVISTSYVRQLNSNKPTVVILPTALYVGICGKPYANTPKAFVVPYSDHSSYPELIQFVSTLKPARVVPIVCGNVRGPFGVDISKREDMSCFQQYLSAPRPVGQPVLPSRCCAAVSCDRQSAGQSCSDGIKNIFPDLAESHPPLKRKRSNQKTSKRRRVLLPKGVVYLSDDDKEKADSSVCVSPQKNVENTHSGKDQNEPEANCQDVDENQLPVQLSDTDPDEEDSDVICDVDSFQVVEGTDSCQRDKSTFVAKDTGNRTSVKKASLPAVTKAMQTSLQCESSSDARSVQHHFTKPDSSQRCFPNKKTRVKFPCVSIHPPKMSKGIPGSKLNVVKTFRHTDERLSHVSTTSGDEPTMDEAAFRGKPKPVSDTNKDKPSHKLASKMSDMEEHCQSVRLLLKEFVVRHSRDENTLSGRQQRAKLMRWHNRLFGFPDSDSYTSQGSKQNGTELGEKCSATEA